METKNLSGFEEIQHTADWALRVWAPNLEELLCTSVAGMQKLLDVQFSGKKRLYKPVNLSAGDLESLLVGFLNEILFWIQTESIACEHCELSIKDTSLSGIVHCASIDGLIKEIKAVTYHNLRIIRSEQGYETTIVFDV